MTDNNRHAGYIVTLGEDIPEDVAESICNAICAIRHVVAVTPVVADPGIAIAEARARVEIRRELVRTLDDLEVGAKLRQLK